MTLRGDQEAIDSKHLTYQFVSDVDINTVVSKKNKVGQTHMIKETNNDLFLHCVNITSTSHALRLHKVVNRIA